VNVLLVVALGSVWLRGYRQHGTRHTLGLLVLPGSSSSRTPCGSTSTSSTRRSSAGSSRRVHDVQAGVTMLCGLELVALAVLARITWR